MSADPSEPLLIVADNYKLATNYAGDHDLGPELGRRWRYISRMDQIVGRRGPGRYVYITAGECRTREQAERLAVVRWLDIYGFTHVDS